MDRSTFRQQLPTRRKVRWLPWVTGIALVAGVGVAALHYSEARAIARVLERAEPWWLLLALALQAGTYIAQGAIWRGVAQAARFPLSLFTSFKLSLAKLFIDQALPSAGFSGTAAVAKSLEERGMRRPAVLAGVVLNTTSYFSIYLLILSIALLLLPLREPMRHVIIIAAVVFILCSSALVALLIVFAGQRAPGVLAWARRFKLTRGTLELLEQADAGLVRRPRLLLAACVCQLTIVVLDAGTIWVLIEAFGVSVPAAGVFASFVISNLFRSLGILPGGLGTFEASSVLTLQLAGTPLPVALSATLLFRALSFWLPMAPGVWLTRQLASRPASPESTLTIDTYWSLTPEALAHQLEARPDGLSTAEADARLEQYGRNQIQEERPLSRLRVALRQLASPLLLLLLLAAGIALLVGEWADAAIVLTIVLASAAIGYRREYSAHAAATKLRERVKARTRVMRDGRQRTLLLEELVPGDVILLSAGSVVPADAIVLEAADAHVSESVLTGESFPVAKTPGVVDARTPLSGRSNCVYLGTNVRSGTLKCLVVTTGMSTQFGAVARRLTLRAPDTDFDRAIRRFGYLLTSAMLIMTFLVFAANVFGGRPLVETLLFSVALAVGLSPELLPAILSVNLARGAQALASHGVLVRRLNAIENLGSMDVLCTDKTGTLTEGAIRLEGAYDALAAASSQVLELAAINAALESGLESPLDEAILEARTPDLAQVRKLVEIPFDFVRKRVSVVVESREGVQLITKGAFRQVIEACSVLDGGALLDRDARDGLERRYSDWSRQGIRVLAVASRALPVKASYGRDDESELTFCGFLTFLDPPKEGTARALEDLSRLGVSVKLITGDTKLVAQHVAALVGMPHQRILSGAQLDELHDEALWREAERTDLFVEVDPNQKERIILSLKKMGHVVGFLGDGVNDAPAMHAADTSLSVEHAVDVAREAADFVLLERDLDVIRRGIEAGRTTFANTLKYILTTTSANLGNMVSMAVASLFLPFLPLLAGQILLNNFLSDIPAVGLASDTVDAELVSRPRRLESRFIGRFMVEFGLLSSAFDLMTFALLLWVFHTPAEVFRTGWFVESLLTELLIVLVVRTRRPLLRSRPGELLLALTLALVVLTLGIAYLPFVHVLGFVPLPAPLLLALLVITALYVLAAEVTKQWFYRLHAHQTPASVISP